MSQSYYRVTYPGLMYSLHTNELDSLRTFLLYFVARYVDRYFSINEIRSYFGNDSKNAIKTIYHLLKMGWINVCDNEVVDFNVASEADAYELLLTIPDQYIVLSDSCGLPVVFHGFSKHEAACISAINCDFMKTIMKSLRMPGVSVRQPAIFSFNWGDTVIQTRVLYVGRVQLCVSTNINDQLSQESLFRVISCLARRYYE